MFDENHKPREIEVRDNFEEILIQENVIEETEDRIREFFPSFACDSRLENPNKQSILQLYEYKKWELEFNYNGWTIAIIVNENAIPDFIDSNNNFIESDDEKILIGSEASKLIKKALEEGYFQVNGFSY